MSDQDKIQELRADNKKLRELLALEVSGYKLYTEEGQLLDDSEYPSIDFAKDTVWEIEQKIFKRLLLKAKNSNPKRLRQLADVMGIEIQA